MFNFFLGSTFLKKIDIYIHDICLQEARTLDKIRMYFMFVLLVTKTMIK